MNKANLKFIVFICFFGLVLMLKVQEASAQLIGSDPLLGADCSSLPQGATRLIADAEVDLLDVVLICDGTVWQRFLPPSSITIDRIQDIDNDTFVDVDTSDDDVIRFSSLGREVANIYALPSDDTFLKILTGTPGSNTGIYFAQSGTDKAYIGLGYGTSDLSIDGITNDSGIGFRTQGYRNFFMNENGQVAVNYSSNPQARIHMQGYAGAQRVLNYADTTSNIDLSTSGNIVFYHDGGLPYLNFDGVNQRLGIGETGDPNSPAVIQFGDRLYVDKVNSRIGINTATPRVALDVDGAMKVGSNADVCDANLVGGIRWSAANTCIEVCDGTVWACSLEASCSTDTPAAWTFNSLINQPVSTVVESNIEQIIDISGCTVEVNISGPGSPEFRICSDSTCTIVDQNWGSAQTTITNNKYIQIRATTPATGGQTQITSLRVGSRTRNWDVATSGSCSDDFPPLGTICADGTVYVGRTNDNFVKMYTTRCDQPRTFDGSSCVGTAVSLDWNNGTTNYVNTYGAYSWYQGQRNTTELAIKDPSLDAGAPYAAAEYCDSLGDSAEASAYGYTDWYLPSADEINQICAVLDPLGFDWNATHWASTETSSDRARYERGDCYSSHANKTSNYRVRCVRKESTTGTDISPDAFSFTDQSNVNVDAVILSEEIPIKGIEAGTSFSVTGDGSPEVSVNGGVDWATAGYMNWDDSVMVRLTSASTGLTMYSAVVTVGGVDTTWNVETGDSTPDPFSFVDQTNLLLNSLVTSASVAITGNVIDASVSVSGDGNPEVSVDGGPWASTGTIPAGGGSLRVRLVTANTINTTRSATVTVGGVNDTWNATTGTDDPDSLTLVSSVPADESTGFNVSDNLVLNFSEDVVALSGDILIADMTAGSDSRSIPINDAQVTIGGSTITINPTTDLLAGRTYEVTMEGGAIEDLSGNDYGGILPGEIDFTSTPITSLAQINGLTAGPYEVTANSQTFTGYVHTDLGSSWLLVGKGRVSWEFDSDGQGTIAGVVANRGTVAGFSPNAYEDAIINDLITNAGINLTGVEILIRRASDVSGTTYQNVLWRPISQTSWVWSFDTTQYQVEHEVLASVLGSGTTFTDDTRDAWVGNDHTRIFTWGWSSHNSQKGFSYGSAISGTNNNDPNTFMWEYGSENHAIPYTEVYIRAE